MKFQIPNGRAYLPVPLEAFDGRIEDCVKILRLKKMLGPKTDKLTLRMVYDEQQVPESDIDGFLPEELTTEPLFLEDKVTAAISELLSPSPEVNIPRLRGVSPVGSKRSRDERDDSSDSEGEGKVCYTESSPNLIA